MTDTHTDDERPEQEFDIAQCSCEHEPEEHGDGGCEECECPAAWYYPDE